MEAKTIRLLGKKKHGIFSQHWYRQRFIRSDTGRTQHKIKVDKLDLMKIKAHQNT